MSMATNEDSLLLLCRSFIAVHCLTAFSILCLVQLLSSVTKKPRPGWFKSLDGHVHVDDVEDLLEHSFE